MAERSNPLAARAKSSQFICLGTTSKSNHLPEARPIPHRIADILREGKAPLLIRRKGAEGDLPVALEEKIEILVTLCQDVDKSIRNTAFATLKGWDGAELRQVFSNPQTPIPLLDFAVQCLVPQRADLAEDLLANPALPGFLRERLQNSAAGSIELPVNEEPSSAGVMGEETGTDSSVERETLLQKISRMSVAEKINAARMGSQEERVILVRDANKVVSRAVLQSPKLSDQEIESIAMMKSVTEEVLRLVATNRKFIRNYGVVRSLVNNPRTPIDVGLPLINRLNDRDLKELSRNKNVAEILRSIATKLIKQKEEANKPKLPGKH